VFILMRAAIAQVAQMRDSSVGVCGADSLTDRKPPSIAIVHLAVS
jgi:hypothetical protein